MPGDEVSMEAARLLGALPVWGVRGVNGGLHVVGGGGGARGVNG